MNSGRDTITDALHDAARDAFMQFWRAVDTDAAEALWVVYCVAQERYEQRIRTSGQARAVQRPCQPS